MRALWTGVIGAVRRRGGRLGLAAALIGLGFASHASAGQGVVNVRCGGDQQQMRMVVELDQSAKGRLIDQGDSRMVTLALPGAGVAQNLQGHCQGLVTDWTMDSVAGAARLRLELSRQAVVQRRFLLPPSDGVSVYRYVMDLGAADGAPPAAARTASLPQAMASDGARLQPASLRTAPPMRLRLKKVIVIDAGHGGKDPGASGANAHEKDLTLAAARALKAALLRTGRYKVVMTRDTDTFVPLQTRVQIARRADADLFISLHADSGSDPSLRGATVYTLSDKGSDRVVRNVMSDSDWFINVNMPGHDRSVKEILLDLTQRSTRNRSDAFAETLVDHVSNEGDVQLSQRSHRDAGYMVLLAPDVPAVLLEMGFITNLEDERLMSDPDVRARFMNSVASAIDDYFGGQARLASR